MKRIKKEKLTTKENQPAKRGFWAEQHLAEVILITDRLSSLIFTIDIDRELHMVFEICIY